MLTGLTWGFGGLWVLNDGTLSFIPDKNGNDIPDGEPIVLLDGWTYDARHNFVNGLMWGPDGWLYGRHGITDTSFPGIPGTPQEQRTPMNCGIWRFHPVRKVFEVVCRGTTNPWGLDYDEHGQFFFTNNVIGHLWHVIPGAHYMRMFGVDFNPHLYDLIDQHADHYHWDTTGTWGESRDGVANSLGGGHSHCGRDDLSWRQLAGQVPWQHVPLQRPWPPREPRHAGASRLRIRRPARRGLSACESTLVPRHRDEVWPMG